MNAAALSMHYPDFSEVVMATGCTRGEGPGIRARHYLGSYPFPHAAEPPRSISCHRIGYRPSHGRT